MPEDTKPVVEKGFDPNTGLKETKPDEVDERALPSEDEQRAMIEEIDAKIKDTQDKMDAADRIAAKAGQTRAQLANVLDDLTQQRSKVAPRINQAQAIQAHLAQQQKNREERGEQAARMRGRPMAPIDASRNNRPGLGSGVKVHPFVSPV